MCPRVGWGTANKLKQPPSCNQKFQKGLTVQLNTLRELLFLHLQQKRLNTATGLNSLGLNNLYLFQLKIPTFKSQICLGSFFPLKIWLSDLLRLEILQAFPPQNLVVCLKTTRFFKGQNGRERIHISQLPSPFQTWDHPFLYTYLQFNHTALFRKQELQLHSNALTGVLQHSQTSQGRHSPKKYIALWHSPAPDFTLLLHSFFTFN